MKHFKLITFFLSFSFILSFGACKKDLGPLTKSSISMIDTQLKKLDTYDTSLKGLKEKSASFPKTFEGVPELLASFEKTEKKITDFRSYFSSAKTKIESTAKAGDETAFGEIIKEIKDKTPGVGALRIDISDATKSFKKIKTAIDDAEKARLAKLWTMKLSTGYALEGLKEGIEKKLVRWITNPEKKVDKATWFDFDRLTFKTGSANLDLEKSKAQLVNMNEILKAYPNVNLKIGGYTDNTGNAKKNVALSKKRAETVKAQLVQMGVDAKRLEAEGYGDKHPVCPANDTPECKAKNRRISVRVTAK